MKYLTFVNKLCCRGSQLLLRVYFKNEFIDGKLPITAKFAFLNISTR